MGTTQGSASSCAVPSDNNDHASEFRAPWALAQARSFDSEDCPFCKLRMSNCNWLQTEIRRLTSEVASLDTTIPPKFHPELQARLEAIPLPESGYTGGVDDITGTACDQCVDVRRQVNRLQREARTLDAQCKARIEFHRKFARRIEALLIEKRRVEAQLYFQRHAKGEDCEGGAEMLDGHFCAITKVNAVDDGGGLLKTAPFVLNDEDSQHATQNVAVDRESSPGNADQLSSRIARLPELIVDQDVAEDGSDVAGCNQRNQNDPVFEERVPNHSQCSTALPTQSGASFASQGLSYSTDEAPPYWLGHSSDVAAAAAASLREVESATAHAARLKVNKETTPASDVARKDQPTHETDTAVGLISPSASDVCEDWPRIADENLAVTSGVDDGGLRL